MISYKTYNKVPGIYKIVNTINNKTYIGSTINLYKRSKEHYNKLKNNTHPNQKLLNSFKKYGSDAFLFEVIESGCNIEELFKLEGYYIQIHKPFFNIDDVNLDGKRKCSDSTKKIIGEKSKQKFIDNPELKEILINSRKNKDVWNKGKTNIYSEETIKKLSEAGKENIKKRPKELQDKFFESSKIAREKRKVKIIQFDLNMKPIREFDSFADAAKAMSAKSVGNFHTACHKHIKLFNSYWRVKK